MCLPPLERGFYQRPTVEVARDLLGKLLVRRFPDGLVAARLTEVEAYLGVSDRACHTFGGRRTPRTEAMWGPAGHLYVYFVYGMHHCANVVTRAVDEPEAVLLRGALAVCGEALIAARRGAHLGGDLLTGPARLCQGLGIDRTLNATDLTNADELWLAADAVPIPSAAVLAMPRVGVGYAGEAASWPLRFVVAGAASLGGRPAVREAGGGGATH